MSREIDTSTVGKVDLSNIDAPSGPAIVNQQREHNSIASFVGKAINGIYNLLPTWVSNTLGSSSDTLKDRIEAHDAAMDNTSGHSHDGTQGGGAQIAAADIADLNTFTAVLQTTTFDSAGGTSDDVSASFTGLPSGGDTSTEGVVTVAPFNNVELRNKSTGDQIEDGGGQKVYGRLTESAGTWTLTYYTNEAGVETSHSLSTVDLRLYFRQVFTLGTKPTFQEDALNIGSLDYTADIVDASSTQRGAISIGTQTLAGDKTWIGAQILDAAFEAHMVTDSSTTGAGASLPLPAKTTVRLTNASLVSINNIVAGNSGRFLVLINKTGGTISLVNDSGGTAANRIQTGTGADLTVLNNGAVWVEYDTTSTRWTVVGGSQSLSLAAVGSSPNANGASYSSGTLTLQPADATHPGVLTELTQNIGGDKTMKGNTIFDGFPNLVETPYTSGGTDPVVIPSKPYIRFTDNTLVSIGNINNTGLGNNPLLIIANLTTNSIVIKNDSTGTAGYRILTGTGANLTLPDQGMLFLLYDLVATRWRVIGGSSTGAVTTMAAVGSSPNNNGATISGSTLTLQPASASFPGVVTVGTQSFGGNKTFSDNVNFTAWLSLSEATNSTATGADASLTLAGPFVRLTNASLTSVGNIVVTGLGNNPVIILANVTGASIVIKNDSTGTATRRIITGTGADLTLADKASILLNYDVTTARWRIIGGSGSSSFTNPMTTLGDLIYGGASGVGTRLAGDTSDARRFLRELSSSGVATAPVWDSLLGADVPLAVPGTTGGTISSSGVPGNTTGSSIASGFVGEFLSNTGSFTVGTGAQSTVASLTLTTGVWLIGASAFGDSNAAQSGANIYLYQKGTNAGVAAKDVFFARYGSTVTAGSSSVTFVSRVLVVASGDADKTVLVKAQSIASNQDFSAYITATRIA